MQHQLGPPLIVTTAAEFAKYTAPILLLHGRWCTVAVWRPFMGYLAHLGWTCHALTLPGHGEPTDPETIAQTGFAEHLEAVCDAIALCEAPPVLIGHDLGGLLALHCTPLARAVVAMAPIIPQPAVTASRTSFARWCSRLARWRSPLLPAPDGPLAIDYFAPRMPGGTTPESARLMDELAHHDLRFELIPAVPKLLVVGQADTISQPDQVERLATATGAAFLRAEGAGHALPWAAGWEQRVTAVHRWLVQQLGESLLNTLPEEEEEP